MGESFLNCFPSSNISHLHRKIQFVIEFLLSLSFRFALSMKGDILIEVTLRLMTFTLKILVCYL